MNTISKLPTRTKFQSLSQPAIQLSHQNEKKKKIKPKAKPISSSRPNMIPAFKPCSIEKPHLPSLIKRKKGEPAVFESKTLSNLDDTHTKEFQQFSGKM